MATSNGHSGIYRTDIETDLARLDGFHPMESEWKRLLHRLVRTAVNLVCRDGEGDEHSLAPLLANHVLTVLADIVRKELYGYNETYVTIQGTAKTDFYTEKLHKDIQNWIERLTKYLNHHWNGIYEENSTIQTAKLIKERLDQSLTEDGNAVDANNAGYYRMLKAVTYIQEHFDYYLEQIESSGNMDGALSLLYVYLKNYCRIAEGFNERFATLPKLYLNEMLQARSANAVQDQTYAVITLNNDTKGFTLPQGQAFPAGQNAAGDELTYHTTQKEYISPVRCTEVKAVYLNKDSEKTTSIREQQIKNEETTNAVTLFADSFSKDLSLGWLIESAMLVLNEGRRNVYLCFRLTTPQAERIPELGFVLQISCADGWAEHSCKSQILNNRLCFEFCLEADDIIPTPCTEEIHGKATEYPAVRLLTDNHHCPYAWASLLNFDAVEIRTAASGIRNFTFYNELGEVDTTQPFAPFGMQAEKEAWFLFGNEEMGLKSLKEVRLKGIWKKVPESESGFEQQYRSYTTANGGNAIKASSFQIQTEYQQDSQWKPCVGEPQSLFNYESNALKPAEIIFNFRQPLIQSGNGVNPYEYSKDKDGFFRATLQSPFIGFGTKAYRNLFTETMIHNSRCKEKDHKPLPNEPVIPMLADVELSYIAEETTTLTTYNDTTLKLSRITELAVQEVYPIEKKEQSFLLPMPGANMLYFAFVQAEGEQSIRMYLDMVLPSQRIPYYNPQLDKSTSLMFECWNGTVWEPLSEKSIIAEETNGLRQSGFVEIKLEQKITNGYIDCSGKAWIRATVTGDTDACLAIRNVWTNCICLVAQNSDGISLPAGTIQGLAETDERIESIVQPLNGFGGKTADTEMLKTVHQSARFHNHHRAVTAKDYEQLVLEHFPEVTKVQCITVAQQGKASDIHLVVFNPSEDDRYYLSPAWKLTEIQRMIQPFASPFVHLDVMNPVYEELNIYCKAVLWDKVQDEGKAVRQLVVLAQNYIAPWYRKHEIPELCQSYSYKELHARMVNHEDLMRLVSLEVNGNSLSDVGVDAPDMEIKGHTAWSVLLPKVTIELLSPHDGINESEIGGNFIIG